MNTITPSVTEDKWDLLQENLPLEVYDQAQLQRLD